MVDNPLSQNLRLNVWKSKLVLVEISRLNHLNVLVPNDRLYCCVRLVRYRLFKRNRRLGSHSLQENVDVWGVLDRLGPLLLFSWFRSCFIDFLGFLYRRLNISLVHIVLILLHIHLHIHHSPNDIPLHFFLIKVLILILPVFIIIILKLKDLPTITGRNVLCRGSSVVLVLEIVRNPKLLRLLFCTLLNVL